MSCSRSSFEATLSAVIDQARQGEPSIITHHGRPEAVLPSLDEWQRLSQMPSFGRLLMAAPLDADELPSCAGAVGSQRGCRRCCTSTAPGRSASTSTPRGTPGRLPTARAGARAGVLGSRNRRHRPGPRLHHPDPQPAAPPDAGGAGARSVRRPAGVAPIATARSARASGCSRNRSRTRSPATRTAAPRSARPARPSAQGTTGCPAPG